MHYILMLLLLIEAEWRICESKLTIIGSGNGLVPGRHPAIIWTNVGILFTGTWGTNFSEILVKFMHFHSKKMHLKMSAKWQLFCLSLSVLNSFIKRVRKPLNGSPCTDGNILNKADMKLERLFVILYTLHSRYLVSFLCMSYTLPN